MKIKTEFQLFSKSDFMMENDPLEEIFALNLGDFLSEHLISKDLAEKTGDILIEEKKSRLKNQLTELHFYICA